MAGEPTREQIVERLRQKLTETMFWLHQAAETVPDRVEARKKIQRAVDELEKLDISVAAVFNEVAEPVGPEE